MLYAKVLEQARYFQPHDLEDWIARESYVSAVRVNVSWSRMNTQYQSLSRVTEGNIETEQYVSWEKRTTYRYPNPQSQ